MISEVPLQLLLDLGRHSRVFQRQDPDSGTHQSSGSQHTLSFCWIILKYDQQRSSESLNLKALKYSWTCYTRRACFGITTHGYLCFLPQSAHSEHSADVNTCCSGSVWVPSQDPLIKGTTIKLCLLPFMGILTTWASKLPLRLWGRGRRHTEQDTS